ncbi:MAG TPA: hypothetical protein DHW61_08925 [Lachnoclostridium phytofermentans]|uniref:Uncharacterized protein n=1 Tax=Lachnoclostridium phytofermentans TaxID=66219 RepID=A0A3D2X5Y6_9FIRM|nr:hypothetical protein [Lachnoclostridium sp.]HCL02522.1 hypothetical protein [Lachnoclostridium phytofermentans]
MKYDQPSQEEKIDKITSLRNFIEDNQDIISELRDTKQPLYYIIVGVDEIQATTVKQQGYYQEMVSLLIDKINLPLQPVKQEELNSIVAEMEEDNLSIVFGHPLVKDCATSILSSKEESLVLVATKKDMTAEEVPYAYWGVEEYLSSYIKDTILDEHTILFNTATDLYHAVLEGEIEGMLIKYSTYESYLQEEKELYLVSDVVFPLQEYIVISNQQEVLLRFMKMFLPFYDNYRKIEQIATAEIRYLRPIHGMKEGVALWTSSIIMGLTFIVTVLYFVFRHRREKKRKQLASVLYQELSVLYDNNQEVFIVDLLTGKIRSNHHFSCFFENQSALHRKHMSLKELSSKIGFNFEEHYRYICRQFDRTYLFQYQLYLGGVRYQVKEEGIFEQGMLVLLISKEK